MSHEFFQQFPHLRGLFGGQWPWCALGPGVPQRERQAQLAALDDTTLFAGAKVRDAKLAACCRSGLWLVFDFLDESHQISQDIATVEGSYWHGIMHRREPDYMNAKYWFRRVPRHPIFEPLGEAARALFHAHAEADADPQAKYLEHAQPWDPLAFVDLCEAIATRKARCEALAREVAMAEWRLLFTYCYAGAIA